MKWQAGLAGALASVAHDGGLRPQLIMLRVRELSALYPTCQ
jgi:hypothetical protein